MVTSKKTGATAKKTGGASLKGIKKQGLLKTRPATADKLQEQKEEFLSDTRKAVQEKNRKDETRQELEQKLAKLENEAKRKEEEEKLKTKRSKRKTAKQKLLTIEEVDIPEEILEQGETRVAILAALNDELSLYCKKNKIRANAQLSLIVYNFLKEKGQID